MIRLLIVMTVLCGSSLVLSAQDTIKATSLPGAQEAEQFYNSGTLKFNNKQFADAMLDFNKAIEFKPDFEKAYFNRGLTKIELLLAKSAIQDFNKSIELNGIAVQSEH